jgi:sporulation protein YlmC with PRC-barrel domain
MKTDITKLFGAQVYTEKALFVGEIDDVILDVDGKKIDSIAVGNLNPELLELKGFRGIKIPFRIIQSIGDVVLVRHLATAFQRSARD